MANFLEQFGRLLVESPRYNLKQVQVENCGYADTAVKSKDCYFSFGAFYCEDVLYSRYSRKCVDCCDIAICFACEGCVGCSDCNNCYGLANCTDCSNCESCYFCEDCYGCKNCFGCVGQYQAQYRIFNQQYTEVDYQNFIAQWPTNVNVKHIQDKLKELHNLTPRIALHHFRVEDSTGDHLSECVNCYECYDSFLTEDCFYCIETNGNKNCADLTVCFENELCYSCVHSPLCYNSNFLLHVDGAIDSELCAYSKNLKNCFGCVYLADKEFYILNLPVDKTIYFQRVEEIKSELITKGFYNMRAFFQTEYEDQRYLEESERAIEPTSEVVMGDNNTSLCCKNAACKKPFRVIAQEAKFYENKLLPLPEHCPTCRHRERMALRSERKLYRRNCGCCKESILTTYPPEASYTIYCQKCFWENIG